MHRSRIRPRVALRSFSRREPFASASEKHELELRSLRTKVRPASQTVSCIAVKDLAINTPLIPKMGETASGKERSAEDGRAL